MNNFDWYRDRDFPEIKKPITGGPAQIVAVVEDEKALRKIIAVHNGEMDAFYAEIKRVREERDELKKRVQVLESALIKMPEEVHRISRTLEDWGFGKRQDGPFTTRVTNQESK